jgi:hypothetical protein
MRPLRGDAGVKHIVIDGRHDATPDDGVAALTDNDTRYGPGQEGDASGSGEDRRRWMMTIQLRRCGKLSNFFDLRGSKSSRAIAVKLI